MNKREQKKCLAVLNRYLTFLDKDGRVAWHLLSSRDQQRLPLEEFLASAEAEKDLFSVPASRTLAMGEIRYIAIFKGHDLCEIIEAANVEVTFTFANGADTFDRFFFLIKESDEWRIWERSDAFDWGVHTEQRIGNVLIVHKELL